MANLLQDFANWSDGTTSPPALWNGTAYVFTAPATITYGGTVHAGDVLLADFTSTGSGDVGYGHQIAVLVNGVDAITWSDPNQSYPTNINITLAAGDTVSIVGQVDGCGYPPTFNIAPAALPVFTYNCDCTDATGNKTLKQLRDDLMRRLGFGGQVNNPPPGMTDLLNSFLIEAQELLYRRYDVLRTERFYSWNLQAGVRFYDIDSNAESCTKRLDPRKLTWVGVIRNGVWTPIIDGIPPELYTMNSQAWPLRYEIRQCIEVWPVPAATEGQLVIKGHFGLEPFAADTDVVTIDDRAVFLLALANAKSHYGRPDAGNYVQELETYLLGLVAGTHGTRRYVPGSANRADWIYTMPKPSVPFS